MRNAIRASVLMLALCCPAFAGNIPNPPGVTTTPTPAPAVQETTTFGDLQPGELPTSGGDIQNGAAATFMQVVLNLLALS